MLGRHRPWGLPTSRLAPPFTHAHYPGGAMGTSRPTAITLAKLARSGSPPRPCPLSACATALRLWGAINGALPRAPTAPPAAHLPRTYRAPPPRLLPRAPTPPDLRLLSAKTPQ